MLSQTVIPKQLTLMGCMYAKDTMSHVKDVAIEKLENASVKSMKIKKRLDFKFYES